MAELAANLPREYEYLEVERSADSVTIRVKNILNAEDMKTWLEQYSHLTLSTWRVDTTYPHSGRVNVFKKDYRCQHRTDRRHSGVRKSKNTNCPATIQVTVRRILKYQRSKLPKLKEYPAFIVFRRSHNHPLSDASVLQHRDMSADVREKLLSLFHVGHTPSSAHNYLKMELILNDPEHMEKLHDAHFVPNVAVIDKLFRKCRRENSSDGSQVKRTRSKVTAREVKAMLGGLVSDNANGGLTSRRRSRPRAKPQQTNGISSDAVTVAAVESVAKIDNEEEMRRWVVAAADGAVDAMAKVDHEAARSSWSKLQPDSCAPPDAVATASAVEETMNRIACHHSDNDIIIKTTIDAAEKALAMSSVMEEAQQQQVLAADAVDSLRLSIDWCHAVVDDFSLRVKQALVEDPASFVPAVIMMQRCMSTYGASDSSLGLLSFLNSMAYTAVPTNTDQA